MRAIQVQEEALDLTLPPLMLLVPFVSFVKHQGYTFLAPEIGAMALGLVSVGLGLGLMVRSNRVSKVLITTLLLVLFVDTQFELVNSWGKRTAGLIVGALFISWVLREHVSRIYTVVFAALLVSTVLIGDVAPTGPKFETKRGAAAAMPAQSEAHQSSDLPVILHIILDGHIAIEAIPTEIPRGTETKAALRSFLLENGFLAFGKAYSEYRNTTYSIAHTLNFSPGTFHDDMLRAGRKGHRSDLVYNAYFDHLADLGYRINVIQTDYLNLCSPHRTTVESCATFASAKRIKPLENLDLPVLTKVRAIASDYAELSFLYRQLRSSYNSSALAAHRHGWALPLWDWERNLGSHTSIPQFDQLAELLSAGSRGQYYLAHVLLPHSPFRHAPDCSLRPIGEWLQAAGIAPHPARNTELSRSVRYALYFGQVRCVIRQLDRLFHILKASGLYDDAVIVLHGDHGSRIATMGFRSGFADLLTPRDYVDYFSALFAVRGPRTKPGYRLDLRSIQDLFTTFVQSEFDGLDGAHGGGAARAAPYIFVNDDDGGGLEQRPMPDFGPTESVLGSGAVESSAKKPE